MHTQRIQQVFQDVVHTIVQHPKLADRLKIKLSEITSDWDELRRRIRDHIACMVQMHRAIIFQDGSSFDAPRSCRAGCTCGITAERSC
ncbi:unnamed protein product [Fasciola hepatica]|uniref:Uncharacterized protein n=1 Tax=Fasciola hepatica TaxID=6192 RepID=A0ABC9HGT1_FASHE